MNKFESIKKDPYLENVMKRGLESQTPNPNPKVYYEEKWFADEEPETGDIKAAPEEADKSVPGTQLDEARKRYVEAKNKYESLGRTKQRIDSSIKELEAAKEVYKQSRGEYVGLNIKKFTREDEKLYEENLRQRLEGRSAGKTLLDGYKKLGDWSIAAKYEQKTGDKIENKLVRGAAKRINVRTAVSAGLFGVSVISGLGMVGAGVLIARRMMTGAGGAVGSYELMNVARYKTWRWSAEKQLDKEFGADRKKVNNAIDQIRARAFLDGRRLEDLRNDEVYQKLLALREKFVGEDLSHAPNEETRRAYMNSLTDVSEKGLAGRLGGEKRARRLQKVAAAAVGGVVGSSVFDISGEEETGLPEPKKEWDPKIIESEGEPIKVDPEKLRLGDDILNPSEALEPQSQAVPDIDKEIDEFEKTMDAEPVAEAASADLPPPAPEAPTGLYLENTFGIDENEYNKIKDMTLAQFEQWYGSRDEYLGLTESIDKASRAGFLDKDNIKIDMFIDALKRAA